MFYSKKLACSGFIIAAACSVASPIEESSKSATTPINLVVVGNSLTLHIPLASIGWEGNWGMAASEESKDFSSQLSKLITVRLARPVNLRRVNMSRFERSFWQAESGQKTVDVSQWLQPGGILVTQLGDNVSESDALTYGFAKAYSDLIDGFMSRGPKEVKLVCLGTWWPNKKRESEIKAACERMNGSYVQISDISTVKSNVAGSERVFTSSGVAAHPGDKGMMQIARRIDDTLKSR
jgi:hypothetical protein